MPTDNPKISAYVPQPVYDRFEEFYKNAGLSMSQAATLILAERFGFEEIVKRITKGNTVEINFLDEIKELRSRLEIVEKKIGNFQGSNQDINKPESNKPFDKEEMDEPQSDSRGKLLNEDKLIINTESNDENILDSSLLDELPNGLPIESTEFTQASLELCGLQGELLEGSVVFDGITALALAKRLISKRTRKPLSSSSISIQMAKKSSSQEFAEWTAKLDCDHVGWIYDEKMGLFIPFGDLSDEAKIKVLKFIQNNLPKRTSKKPKA
jgi:hypothetical protein